MHTYFYHFVASSINNSSHSYLRSEIIILHVGPTKIQFQAYELALQKIPLFKISLLETQPKETGAVRSISLPDDNANGIAALIQYLYSETYTHNIPEVPTRTLIEDWGYEGVCHAWVYKTAARYKCLGLCKLSAEKFWEVSERMIEADLHINAVKLWRSAYGVGFHCFMDVDGHNKERNWKGTLSCVKDLANNKWGAVRGIMIDCPELACDLLALTSKNITVPYAH